MSARTVVGLKPWLPWPLSRQPCWTEPVRAERLAALRIGLACVLLLDLLFTYWPHLHDFFGRDSLGSPELFAWMTEAPSCRWSLLRGVAEPWVLQAALATWTVATVLLALGFWTRASAAVVWLLSTSFANLNAHIENAGDLLRGIILFYLMLSPCGAAWSLDHWLRRRRGADEPVYVYPWPLRLLFVQMVLIYFCNGLYKIVGDDWRSGNALYYVLGDVTIARWSYAQLPVPYVLTRLLTWAVLGWELSFPLLVCWRRTRKAALWFGVAFHVGIGLSLELGGFAPYMLCLYLPFLFVTDSGGSLQVQLGHLGSRLPSLKAARRAAQ